jgi:hypothetical protein
VPTTFPKCQIYSSKPRFSDIARFFLLRAEDCW